MEREGRILHRDWDLYDTRHCVYRPKRMAPGQLESGYWRAYADFYKWGSILRGATTKENWLEGLRHVALAAGWKKLEPIWDLIIRARSVCWMLPVLERLLEGSGKREVRGTSYEVRMTGSPNEVINS